MSFTLEQMQSWMQGALHAPTAVPSEQANSVLISRSGFSGAQGLAVYQRSYFLRIVTCMRDQFPALCHALGQELFDDFVAEYIVAAPPQSYTLYDLGRRFPDYLQANRPDDESAREVWIDFIVDLARFERQVFVMFDTAGAEDAGYATVETPDDRLQLQPAFSLGRYRFPVAVYYHAVRAKSDPVFPPLEPMWLALVRKDFLTRTIPFSMAHFEFLSAVSAGHSVPQALDLLARKSNQAPDQVHQAWRTPGGTRDTWIKAGMFVAD